MPRLEPWTRLIATSQTSPLLAVSHYAGLARATVGELDGAAELLELAVDKHRALRAPFFVACSEIALATVLEARRDGSDLERARELALVNRTLAESRGYSYLARDANLLLDRLS